MASGCPLWQTSSSHLSPLFAATGDRNSWFLPNQKVPGSCTRILWQLSWLVGGQDAVPLFEPHPSKSHWHGRWSSGGSVFQLTHLPFSILQYVILSLTSAIFPLVEDVPSSCAGISWSSNNDKWYTIYLYLWPNACLWNTVKITDVNIFSEDFPTNFLATAMWAGN